MTLQKLDGEFAVCKIASLEHVQLERAFTFLSKTDEELSLVCPVEAVPQDATVAERDWRGLKICGVLDFGLVGIIARISSLLAEAGISVFVISTYNTDYVFLKRPQYEPAIALLQENGYDISQ